MTIHEAFYDVWVFDQNSQNSESFHELGLLYFSTLVQIFAKLFEKTKREPRGQIELNIYTFYYEEILFWYHDITTRSRVERIILETRIQTEQRHTEE